MRGSRLSCLGRLELLGTGDDASWRPARGRSPRRSPNTVLASSCAQSAVKGDGLASLIGGDCSSAITGRRMSVRVHHLHALPTVWAVAIDDGRCSAAGGARLGSAASSHNLRDSRGIVGFVLVERILELSTWWRYLSSSISPSSFTQCERSVGGSRRSDGSDCFYKCALERTPSSSGQNAAKYLSTR